MARVTDIPLIVIHGGGHSAAVWRASLGPMLQWMTPKLTDSANYVEEMAAREKAAHVKKAPHASKPAHARLPRHGQQPWQPRPAWSSRLAAPRPRLVPRSNRCSRSVGVPETSIVLLNVTC